VIDPKGTKCSLVNSPTCPEFPDSEWTNILAGRAINLDAVLSGYYSTSNNDERVEEIGDLEICFVTVNPTKTVSTAGEWSIAWNRALRATSTAFPHRAGELAEYAEYIIGLFAATDVHFHDRVILFDKAVRRRVGTHRDLELMDFNNSQISDQPTWTRLVPPLFNGHLSPSIYLIQTLGRRYLNHATVGMRVYAHLRLLSVADSTFAANAPNPDISALTVQLDFSCFWLPHAFARSPIHNLIQPPRVQLGVILK